MIVCTAALMGPKKTAEGVFSCHATQQSSIEEAD